VLCSPEGEVFGALSPFAVDTPWWQEVAPVIEGARARHGVGVTILRLLETEDSWPPHGGDVTYLAEISGSPPADLEPARVDMGEHPARRRWARPGGVADLVAWADGFVDRTGPARQLRTWNLSVVVQLPTTDGVVWLKAVPPFMAHEGAVIEAVGAIGPPLLARGDGSVLLEDVPGEDQYDAPVDVRIRMVQRWVDFQSRWTTSIPGLPDWSADSFVRLVEPLIDRPEVEALVAELPDRFDALGDCGLPDTLVHGDFHAGNWHGDRLLDWGDSGFGHALLDQPAFFRDGHSDEVRTAWRDAWRDARPRSDPERAMDLIAPIAALRQARIYRTFIENIEPSEHCYHRHDTEEWLARAVELGRMS